MLVVERLLPSFDSRNLRTMCFAVKCTKCNKTTWSGCGMHIESVKANVPAAQWCGCPR